MDFLPNLLKKSDISEHNNAMAYKMVVSIDFGTTTSAMAFSYENKPEEIFVFTNYSDGSQTSGKIPTAIIFDKKQKFVGFGNTAFTRYNDYVMKDQQNDVYFFQNFKMKLYDDSMVDENLMLSDITGKQMNALQVFTAAIKFFTTTILNDVKQRKSSLRIEERDIKWIITVPAIWNEKSKQFMRTAAEKAGCNWRSIAICLEPEAASIYGRQSPILQQNHYNFLQIECAKYLVIDIGGGTLDITAHEVDEEQAIREIHCASGNDWAGNKVDNAFIQLLESLFSVENVKEIRDEHPEEFLKIMREFLKGKQEANFDNVAEVSIMLSNDCPWNKAHFNALPRSFKRRINLTNKGGLFFPKQLIVNLIQSTSKEISHNINLLLKKENLDEKLNYIIMVGGFSRSKYVVNDIKRVTNIPVIVPEHSELCVVKGAVMFGWKEDVIRSRKARKTYGVSVSTNFIEGKHDEKRASFELDGTKKCRHFFKKLVTVNDDITINLKVTYSGRHPNRDVDETTIELYATDDPEPMYTDVDGVELIGEIIIPTGESARGKSIEIELFFGQTEIKVVVKDKASGKIFTGNFKCQSSSNVLKLVD